MRNEAVIEGGRLGKYEVVGTLGKGAMGTVFDARDPVIDRRVAIKTLPMPDPADVEAQDELARFKREAQAAGRLTHPNIVGVYDYGETERLAYIVMEFVDGTSLKTLLERHERFTPAETVRVMTGLLAGLQYSHDRGVVHRDIKPANVMITAGGVVKIADFGIARIESSSMTQAGTIMGTPAYMSPEQFMGQTVDARTDIYSAGVLLYQMLTGERPFEGSMTAIMHKALNTVPPRPSELSVTAPPAMDDVVSRAMAKRPEDRFATATAFAEALQVALHVPAPPAVPPASGAGESDATMVMPARPATVPPIGGGAVLSSPAPVTLAADGPRRRGGFGPLLIGAGLAGLVIVAGGIWFLLTPASAPPPPIPPKPAPQVLNTSPVPPPSPPKPSVSIEKLRSDVAAALAGASSCSAIGGDVLADGSVALDGVMPARDAPALRQAVSSAAQTAPTRWNVASFTGPYCDVLATLRPIEPRFGEPGAKLGLQLKGGGQRLRKDDYMIPVVAAPDFPSYIQLDYFPSDGSLAHLHDPAQDRGHPSAAGANVRYGDPTDGQKGWQVDAPWGTDLLVAIASDRPLFDKPRPADETAAAYLKDLTAAIASAQRAGARIAGRATVVETTEK